MVQNGSSNHGERHVGKRRYVCHFFPLRAGDSILTFGAVDLIRFFQGQGAKDIFRKFEQSDGICIFLKLQMSLYNHSSGLFIYFYCSFTCNRLFFRTEFDS